MELYKNTRITFVFKKSRGLKQKQNSFPDDHYYSFFHFKKNFPNTSFIEMKESGIVISFLFKIYRKFTTRPLYTENFLNISTIIKIFNSDVLIITNQNQYYYIRPILKFIKIFKKIKICYFVMGLNENFQFSDKYLQNVFIKNVDHLLFLSIREFEYYKKTFSNDSLKFEFLPFGIDLKFWTRQKQTTTKEILYVGSDLKRDTQFLKSLVSELTDNIFNIISSRPELEELSTYNNVNYYSGSWENNNLSDLELKKIMENSAVSIIPLLDTLQPSGQSVALQSMALGVPVIITKTKGFWDSYLFRDNENIIFMDNNHLEIWAESILNILNNNKLRTLIGKSGKEVVENNFSSSNTYLKLTKILNLT